MRRIVIGVLVLSQALDVATSTLGFRAGNIELNPLFHSTWGLTLGKLAALSIILSILGLVAHRPRVWNPVAAAVCFMSGVMATVGLHNLVIA